jgi:hypothetical protein
LWRRRTFTLKYSIIRVKACLLYSCLGSIILECSWFLVEVQEEEDLRG